jgi:hypothetical protein
MGFFDFLFRNKNKEEQERLGRERLAEQELQRKAEEKRNALECERRLEDNKRKEEERKRRIAEEQHLKKERERQASIAKEPSYQFNIVAPNTETNPIIESISEELNSLACQANYGFNMGNRQMAISAMNQLFQSCYGREGHKLLNVSPENCQPIGLAFANIAIYLNFNDRDLNSVAAENAFYCLARSFIAKSNTFSTPALFTMLLKYQDLLKDKLISTHCSMAEKRVGMPIGMMLGGNPFQAPHLADFREQAVSKRVDIMSYLICFFYDLDNSEYKVPTDMPYLIPDNRDLELFKTLVFRSGSSVKEMQDEGQKYFYAMFENCENTLSKC